MVKTHKLFNAAILTCPLEEDMDIIVVPINPCEREDYDKEELFKKANQFYEDWFANEKDDIGDSTLPDYVEEKMNQAGYILKYHYKMYPNLSMDRLDALV